MSPIPTPAPVIVSGLVVRASGQPIPLDHVRVEAHIVDLCARVTVHQHYRNREDVPLEAVYVFPLDEGAAVCGFDATVDGVRYAGRVVERDAAFKEYDDALEAGHGGFLLDEERADVFTASVGNLKPGSEAVLSITYVSELAAEGAAVRFTLPTTVSPRYAPVSDRAGVGPTPADVLNPPVAADVPYAFTIDMDVTMNGVVRAVQSPSHPIEVEQDGTHARVRLAQRNAPMDRDFVVVVAAEGLDVPHATVERGERGGALLLSFVPRFDVSASLAEVVFVIDRSGSMQGTSIAEVRNALQLCLRSLVAGCRFNIVSFGSTFETLFPESRRYDDESMSEAAAFVSTLDANMGGTELLPALAFALGQAPVGGLPRQVLVLTDGEVTNTDEVINLARAHAATARCFTFGIGAGASQHLVRGIARASGGAAEFISPGERIEAKVMRQFKRVFTPALTDAQVNWGDCGATAASDRLPTMFSGERVTVYAFADQPRAATATLSGTLNGRAVAFDVPVEPDHAVAGDTVATLAARARIRTIEEQGEYLESRGSNQRRGRGATGAAAEIAALGVRYQLCSRETSFVAVEHRDMPAAGRSELRRVPVALTSGWGGQHGRPALGLPQPVMMPSAAMPSASIRHAFRLASPPPAAGGVAYASAAFDPAPEMCACAPPDGVSRSVARKKAPPAPSRPHDRVVGMQRADGSWDLTPEFARAIAEDVDVLLIALQGATGDPALLRRALATALAVAWLERSAANVREEWAMLADKARHWLATCGTAPGGDDGWIDVAARLLG